jgi:hypothetical protein
MIMRNFLFILALLQISCTTNIIEEKNAIKKPVGRYLEIPGWFIDFPKDDYSLGISKLSLDNLEVKTSALQNAAVNYCRNKNSYVVNKEAIRNTEQYYGSGKREFQVVVTSNPQQLHEAAKNLRLTDYFWFYDNFVGLYGFRESAIDTTRFSVWINEENITYRPDWFHEEIMISDNGIYADVWGTSHELIYAWRNALDKGRVKLAGYSQIKVDATIYNSPGMHDKLVSLETSTKIQDMIIDKIYARRYQGSGGAGYEVYVRMTLFSGEKQ